MSVALLLLTGCDKPIFSPSVNISSQFDIKLTDIGFSHNIALFSSDTLSIRGDTLLFKVDVTPKDTFTGEPFEKIKILNEEIIHSTPAIWVALLSRDGYYFHSQGPLTWTPEELQLPDTSERDYYKIQSMEAQRVKHVQMFAPSSDKATVALLQDSNELMAELRQEQWKYLISGDWLLGEDLPEEADEEYIRSEFEKLFNKYFKLMIVDSDGLQELEDSRIKPIATWTGKGVFTTPIFSVTEGRLIPSWIGNPPGRFEYRLYSSDGTIIFGVITQAGLDKKEDSAGCPVSPGNSYYIEIIAPEEMQWTFWLEETKPP